jgi:membrane protein insertase Oxa1/YidC/SpoIIIJ
MLEQVESTLAMQNLQPKIKAIQTRYKGEQERIQLETSRLYKQAGVNPLAGAIISHFHWKNNFQYYVIRIGAFFLGRHDIFTWALRTVTVTTRGLFPVDVAVEGAAYHDILNLFIR